MATRKTERIWTDGKYSCYERQVEETSDVRTTSVSTPLFGFTLHQPHEPVPRDYHRKLLIYSIATKAIAVFLATLITTLLSSGC